jgi:hypothetical protein
MVQRKVNKTGRNLSSEHFTKMFRSTMQTPAWAALSSSAQSVYPWVKLEWRGPNANNNGRIQFSYRQAAKAIGTTPNTVMAAFRDLQAKGFLVVTQMGVLGIDGDARGPSYEVTEIAMPGCPNGSGRELFRQWLKGRDFPIVMHAKNNPTGKNGRKIPSSKFRRSHLQNDDDSVLVDPKTSAPHLQIEDDLAKIATATITVLKTSLYASQRAGIGLPDLRRDAGLELCPLLAGRRVG